MTANAMTARVATGMTANGSTTRMTAGATPGMTTSPMMPAVAAAPADAGGSVLVTPVPAGAVPTVVVPAIIVTKPNELRALDDIQAIGRTANRSRCDHCAGAHDRCADDENGCGRNGNSQSSHDAPLVCIDQITKYERNAE
jgi:hypothetical protein